MLTYNKGKAEDRSGIQLSKYKANGEVENSNYGLKKKKNRYGPVARFICIAGSVAYKPHFHEIPVAIKPNEAKCHNYHL